MTLDPCVFAVPWIPSAYGEAQGVPIAEMKLLRSCFNLTPQMPGWFPFDGRRGGPDPTDFEIEGGPGCLYPGYWKWLVLLLTSPINTGECRCYHRGSFLPHSSLAFQKGLLSSLGIMAPGVLGMSPASLHFLWQVSVSSLAVRKRRGVEKQCLEGPLLNITLCS